MRLQVDQPYKIARELNKGMLVAPMAAEIPRTGVATGLLARSARHIAQKVGSIFLPERRLFVPFDEEADLHVLGVIILGDNHVKFCQIQGIQPATEFQGTTRKMLYSEDGVLVESTREICGIQPGSFRNAYVRFCGDGKQSNVVIHDLVPISL
jgi:hypothetical protein